MPKTPLPDSLEAALKLFPKTIAAASYINGKWRFSIENMREFFYDQSPWRETWQAAFRDVWEMYSKHPEITREPEVED